MNRHWAEKIALAHETVSRTVVTTRAALEQLLAGPDPTETAIGLSSAIPSDAQLVDAAITNRLATIVLTGSFDSDGTPSCGFAWRRSCTR